VGHGISTLPPTRTPQGGTATVLVDIIDPSGVDTTSVKIDVMKQTGFPYWADPNR